MSSSSPTNVILFDKLYEVQCLGDACLISIITTINLLLVSINDVIKCNKNGGSHPYYPHIKQQRRTLQSLKKEYGSLFQHTYRMDYITFKSLHRLLQKGIQEYIINEREINDRNNGLDFYMRNGQITTEICLACALWYFTGGSYLDIMLSHGIGKTDLYHSIWAVIHATNICPRLQFSSQQHYLNANPLPMNSLTEAKLDFIIVLVVLMGCWGGQKNHLKKQCMEVGVDNGKFYCGRKGKFGLNLQLCNMSYV